MPLHSLVWWNLYIPFPNLQFHSNSSVPHDCRGHGKTPPQWIKEGNAGFQGISPKPVANTQSFIWIWLNAHCHSRWMFSVTQTWHKVWRRSLKTLKRCYIIWQHLLLPQNIFKDSTIFKHSLWWDIWGTQVKSFFDVQENSNGQRNIMSKTLYVCLLCGISTHTPPHPQICSVYLISNF